MKVSLLLALLLSPLVSWSQQIPPIRWQECYGGSTGDLGLSIIPTADGGSLVAGATYSAIWDDSLYGYNELLILKLDSKGTVEWEKIFGGPGHESASDIIHTADDNYIVVGSTESTSGDITGNHGLSDVWVIKITPDGEFIWQKCFGGSNFDLAYGASQDSKGNVVIIGITESIDGDVHGLHSIGHSDVWVLKIDLNGKLLWQKCYGGTETEAWSVWDVPKGSTSIVAAENDGFVFVSTTSSIDGDLRGRSDSDWSQVDIWVAKIDSTGTIEWQHDMGDGMHDEPYSIIRTRDSGYVIGGLWTQNLPWPWQYDGYLRKLRNDGSMEWQRLYGTDTTTECITTLIETEEGFLLGGLQSKDFISRFGNESEVWLLSTDRFGNVVEERTFGGSKVDYLSDIIRNDDGSFALVGSSSSIDGTLQNIRTDSTQLDVWVLNLGSVTKVAQQATLPFAVYPNPTQLNVHVDFGLISPSSIRHELRTMEGDLLEEAAQRLIPSGKHSHLLNLSSYSSGSYLYTLYINDVPHTETIRLVK